jgi:hypothetical protein
MNKHLAAFFLMAVYLAPAVFSGDVLHRQYDLSGKRSAEKQYFVMETAVIKIAPNGEQSNRDIFRLYLVADPTQNPQQPLYTCAKMGIQFSGGKEKTVPVLDGWSYQLSTANAGMDDKGQVFGIPHSQFENLIDSGGSGLDQEHGYMVYNTFIDFHSFSDVFARPTEGGKGVQDLSRIGDKIIHAAAFTEPPVNLGSNIKEGSTFKNGEVTLEFKGLSLVNEKECALLAYDSGASSFHMIMEPMPAMMVETHGSSHYFGDIFLDLKSLWVQQVVMAEFVVSETNIASMNMKINGVIERQTTICNVDADTFNAALSANH